MVTPRPINLNWLVATLAVVLPITSGVIGYSAARYEVLKSQEEIRTRVSVIEAELGKGERFTRKDGADMRREFVQIMTSHVSAGPHDKVAERLARIETKIDSLVTDGHRQDEWIRRVRDSVDAMADK